MSYDLTPLKISTEHVRECTLYRRTRLKFNKVGCITHIRDKPVAPKRETHYIPNGVLFIDGEMVGTVNSLRIEGVDMSVGADMTALEHRVLSHEPIVSAARAAEIQQQFRDMYPELEQFRNSVRTTVTGRTSSREPELQEAPRDTSRALNEVMAHASRLARELHRPSRFPPGEYGGASIRVNMGGGFVPRVVVTPYDRWEAPPLEYTVTSGPRYEPRIREDKQRNKIPKPKTVAAKNISPLLKALSRKL